ncbi:hypothetical protein RR46_04047 [Papilio xuthus]|uniref:Peptidase S1 domain-containing protein n=1 Tax=Papilio xuthus TaxID=66420 RepID=A0A194QJX1_PAPXU|nr:hypothetical protein RR46_04047 [Papilio xuthus]
MLWFHFEKVYFIHSDQSTTRYNGWTCAGALVHSLYVVTAAACLEDVTNLYAMAGYAKWVPYEDIDVNKCTSNVKTQKKKVVYTCIPKSYELDYANVEKWSSIDIGVAKVENRFWQHNDYEKLCTVKPLRIPINFNSAYQSPGIDAIVAGWGHLETWRKPGDPKIYIQEFPRYASVRIMNKKKCKEYYKDYPELQKTIDKHMICTMESGNVNAAGVVNWSHPEFKDQCTEDNDHGAPLTTWIGGKEHLIGVASVFRVNQEGKCAGPYLFTSTQCNGVFLDCVLEEHLYKSVGGSGVKYLTCDLQVLGSNYICTFIRCSYGEGKHGDATCTYLRRNSQICVKSTNPHLASVVDYGLVTRNWVGCELPQWGLIYSYSQRRIRNGKPLGGKPKTYAVYLVRSEKSTVKYTDWVCGGALVSKLFIVTAAACLEDVDYIYAVGGVKDVVEFKDLGTHTCTKWYKRKVVYTCVPRAYEFDYANIEKWSAIDIGIAKIDSEFAFEKGYCDYDPAPIPINYDPKFQEPGTDAIVIGWGHSEIWKQFRAHQSNLNNNTIDALLSISSKTPTHPGPQILKTRPKSVGAQWPRPRINTSPTHPDEGPTMGSKLVGAATGRTYPGDDERLLQREPHYASVSITNKKKCKEGYSDIPELQDIIEKYMICTIGAGNLDNQGNIMTTLKPESEGCPQSNSKGECRRSLNGNITLDSVADHVPTRRHGICQNDHGGPLVTWIGGREYLIGVASVFRVNNESKCEGPYLFTSTQCNGAFLNCILNPEKKSRRANSICDMPAKERGFEMIHRHISWTNHPDG